MKKTELECDKSDVGYAPEPDLKGKWRAPPLKRSINLEVDLANWTKTKKSTWRSNNPDWDYIEKVVFYAVGKYHIREFELENKIKQAEQRGKIEGIERVLFLWEVTYSIDFPDVVEKELEKLKSNFGDETPFTKRGSKDEKRVIKQAEQRGKNSIRECYAKALKQIEENHPKCINCGSEKKVGVRWCGECVRKEVEKAEQRGKIKEHREHLSKKDRQIRWLAGELTFVIFPNYLKNEQGLRYRGAFNKEDAGKKATREEAIQSWIGASEEADVRELEKLKDEK